jgi:hypothetical protein
MKKCDPRQWRLQIWRRSPAAVWTNGTETTVECGWVLQSGENEEGSSCTRVGKNWSRRRRRLK